VRVYARHLLGQVPWDVPSEGELLAFEDGQAPGPTTMSFRLDLASQGLASRWNAQAAEIFADAFLNKDELAREFSDRANLVSLYCPPYRPAKPPSPTNLTCKHDRQKSMVSVTNRSRKHRNNESVGLVVSPFPSHAISYFAVISQANKCYKGL